MRLQLVGPHRDSDFSAGPVPINQIGRWNALGGLDRRGAAPPSPFIRLLRVATGGCRKLTSPTLCDTQIQVGFSGSGTRKFGKRGSLLSHRPRARFSNSIYL